MQLAWREHRHGGSPDTVERQCGEAGQELETTCPNPFYLVPCKSVCEVGRLRSTLRWICPNTSTITSIGLCIHPCANYSTVCHALTFTWPGSLYVAHAGLKFVILLTDITSMCHHVWL